MFNFNMVEGYEVRRLEPHESAEFRIKPPINFPKMFIMGCSRSAGSANPYSLIGLGYHGAPENAVIAGCYNLSDTIPLFIDTRYQAPQCFLIGK